MEDLECGVGVKIPTVDVIEAINNKLNKDQVLTPVPVDALFTDTLYDDTALQAEVDLNTAKVSNVDHPLVEKAVPSDALFTDTTYTVGDGGLTEINFTSADNTKLDGIEALADVTDVTNVTAAGAAMLTGATFTGAVTADDFIGPLNGAIQFIAKNRSGGTINKGQAIYISGISGNTPEIGLADANNASTMPAFGLAGSTATDNNNLEVVTFGSLHGVQTDYTGWALGDTLYISTTAGTLTNVAPSGEAAKIQNIGTVERLHSSNGTIKVGGAGRTNATPNLDDGNVFIGNASNQSSARALVIGDTTGLQTALDAKVDDSQVLTDVPAGAVFTDTLTSLTLVGNNLTYTDENGASVVHDLTLYLDDTNLAVLVSGVYNAPTQELIFTRDDGSTFTVDASMFFDDTNLVTSVSGRAGAVTLTKVDVALGNVDNTSDLAKPISTATQTALDDKYPLVAAPATDNIVLFETGGLLKDSGKDLDNLVTQTSPVASAQLPTGTTAQRDSTPTNGMIRYNADDDSFEGYANGAWGAIGGGGGATGGGSDDAFYENSQHVTQSYELTAGKNAMSAGPITIDNGVTVTVPTGAVWTIV